MAHDVFISHASKDKQIADAICHALEENKIACWIAPRDIQPGKTWASEIMRGIKDCQLILLVFTKNANISEHVANEINIAFSHKKIIIPFLVDNEPMNEDFNYYLNRKHWLVAYPNYKEKFAELITSVLHILKREPVAIKKAAPEKIPVQQKNRKISKFLLPAVAAILVLAAAVICWKFIPAAKEADLPKVEASREDTTAILNPVLIEEKPVVPETKIQKDTGPSISPDIPQANVKQAVANQKKTIFIRGNKYTGNTKNGVPDGMGVVYYTTTSRISDNDPKETLAEPGDYLDGRWHNGELEFGTLYDKEGNKKTTVRVGRY